VNVIFGIILLILCIYLGRKLSEKFVNKRKFFDDFISFNNCVKNEISFGQASLVKIINSQENKGDFYDCSSLYLRENKFVFNKNYINDREKEFYKNYLESVGRHDKKTQLEYLTFVGGELDKMLFESKENEKKYKVLYIKLGVLFGIMALIIML